MHRIRPCVISCAAAPAAHRRARPSAVARARPTISCAAAPAAHRRARPLAAGRCERALPDKVDSGQHGGLLDELGLDLHELLRPTGGPNLSDRLGGP